MGKASAACPAWEMLVAAGSGAEGPEEDEGLLSCGRARDRLLRAALAGGLGLLPATGSAGKANAKPCSSSEIYFTRNSPQTAGKPLVTRHKAGFAQSNGIKAGSNAEMHLLKTFPLSLGYPPPPRECHAWEGTRLGGLRLVQRRSRGTGQPSGASGGISSTPALLRMPLAPPARPCAPGCGEGLTLLGTIMEMGSISPLRVMSL